LPTPSRTDAIAHDTIADVPNAIIHDNTADAASEATVTGNV
jgi:hypothetical protein